MYSVPTGKSRSAGGARRNRTRRWRLVYQVCFRSFHAGGCMYSIVLMMAMTSPADDIAIGRRGGCDGGAATACAGGGDGSSCDGGRGGFLGLRGKLGGRGASCAGSGYGSGCSGYAVSNGCDGGRARGGLFA